MKKLVVLSLFVFLVELCVGIPFGFFEMELGEALGLLQADILGQLLSCCAVFVVCFFFARKWMLGALLRSVLAISLVELVSAIISLSSSSGLPPLLLWVTGVVMGVAFAAAGAMAGRRAVQC